MDKARISLLGHVKVNLGQNLDKEWIWITNG